jgi:hypothetical protein
MNNIDFKKDILPHLIAIIIFFVISTLFYSPLIFEAKTLGLHDVQQGLGGGQEASEFRATTGEEALWSNSMFGGMPTYLVNTRWGDTAMWYTVKVLGMGLPSPASLTLIAMICFYLMLVVAGVRSWIAILGAIGFGLSSFFIISIGAGHIWKMRAIAFAPLVIAGFYLLFEKKHLLWGFILSALGLSLEIWSNHLQITYYLMLLLLIFGASMLYYAIKDKTYRELLTSIGVVLLAVLLAVAVNLDRLWSTFEYGKYSTRGQTELTVTSNSVESGLDRDYVFRWSSGIAESMTLMIPYFYGGGSQEALDEDSEVAKSLELQGASRAQIRQTIASMPTYWGDQPITGGPIYAGAIICFFFVLGITTLSPRHKTWLIVGTIFSLMLAWGSNFSSFNYLMYDQFPGYNKFRAVSMAITIALITMPFLGALGLEKLFSTGINPKTQRQLLIALGTTGGLSLLLVVFAGMLSYQGAVDGQLPDWLLAAIRADRQRLLRGDALRSFLLIAMSGGVIFFMLKDKLSHVVGAGLLMLFMFFDHFMVDKRYLNSDNFTKNANRTYFAANNADKQIKADPNPGRVLNLLNPWNEARTSYHHQSLGGYHGAKLKRTQELIDYCLGNQVNEVINTLRSQSSDFSPLVMVNMLNTKYFTFGEEAGNVVPNTNAYGNAWLVSNVQQVNNADEEIAATCNLQSQNTAIIDMSKFPTANTSYSTDGSIALTEYLPNKLTYAVNVSGEQALAVFSEIYYAKGWTATIDGQETTILRANYILRGLEIPRGEHTVVFTFKPSAYHLGSKVATTSSILLLLIAFGGLGFSIKKLF